MAVASARSPRSIVSRIRELETASPAYSTLSTCEKTKPSSVASARERVGSAPATSSEMDVVAQDEMCHMEPFAQDLANEFVVLHALQVFFEVQYIKPVQAGGIEQCNPFLQVWSKVEVAGSA